MRSLVDIGEGGPIGGVGHGTAMRTEIVDSIDGLRRHERAWLELLERSWSDQVTLSPAWLLAWWNVFGGLGQRQLRALLFWSDDRLVGFAPLLRRLYLSASGIPFIRLELVATGEPEEHEIASDYVGVVAERGAEREVAAAFAAHLTDRAAGPWDELRLAALDASIPMTPHLQAALASAGLPAELREVGGSPYIPLPASFDAYLAALDGPGRYFVRRTLRDHEAWAKGRDRVFSVESPADLERALPILMQLHAERWHGDGRTGVFASPLFRAFHEAVLPELLARGALDLRWMTVDDQPVAVNYSLVSANRLQFYQSGRALELPKGARPGIVLHVAAIKAAIAAGRSEYDFLAGSHQYKRQMALQTRPMGQLLVERPGLRRFAHRAAGRAWRWWKQRRT